MAQGSSSGTSRRHPRNEHDTSSISSSRYVDAEWEAKEALRQRELEEARARATQMEKTMRWWSDCTANWREKWSKVRNERNKAREEAKLLRTKLDTALKDLNSQKREKEELEIQNDQLKKEMEKIHLLLLKHAGQWDAQLIDALESIHLDREILNNSSEPLDICDRIDTPKNTLEDSTIIAVNSISNELYNLQEALKTKTERTKENDPYAEAKESSIEEYVLQGAVPRHAVEIYNSTKENSIDNEAPEVNHEIEDENSSNKSDTSSLFPGDKRFSQLPIEDLNSIDQEFLLQKLSMLQLRLDEASKTILAEREEKSNLHRELERLEGELQDIKKKCDDLRTSKQEVVRELLQLQDLHQDQVRMIQLDLQDEANSREGMDKRLADLRSELEKLQTENASEWGKRERLETEKIGLERDNKKLRSEVRDLQERLERKGRPLSTSDTDLRHIQQELMDRNKELSDLKHSHSKLKKILQDKSTELAHAIRRAEQYEAEVRRLRGRVEELKRELAVAEDEVDSASNTIRKLQRTNDELQEQVETFQVQVEHLHTRHVDISRANGNGGSTS